MLHTLKSIENSSSHSERFKLLWTQRAQNSSVSLRFRLHYLFTGPTESILLQVCYIPHLGHGNPHLFKSSVVMQRFMYRDRRRKSYATVNVQAEEEATRIANPKWLPDPPTAPHPSTTPCCPQAKAQTNKPKKFLPVCPLTWVTSSTIGSGARVPPGRKMPAMQVPECGLQSPHKTWAWCYVLIIPELSRQRQRQENPCLKIKVNSN